MHERQLLGATGEELAAKHVTDQGLEVLDRNWRTSVEGVRGELDLVVRDGETVALIEVRTRRSHIAGSAAESVGSDKRRRLRRLAALYLQSHPHPGPVRGDVIAVHVPVAVTDPSTSIVHLRGVW
ncbi:MAG: YraN family protein [Euzebya sp.]